MENHLVVSEQDTVAHKFSVLISSSHENARDQERHIVARAEEFARLWEAWFQANYQKLASAIAEGLEIEKALHYEIRNLEATRTYHQIISKAPQAGLGSPIIDKYLRRSAHRYGPVVRLPGLTGDPSNRGGINPIWWERRDTASDLSVQNAEINVLKDKIAFLENELSKSSGQRVDADGEKAALG